MQYAFGESKGSFEKVRYMGCINMIDLTVFLLCQIGTLSENQCIVKLFRPLLPPYTIYIAITLYIARGYCTE